ncbi:MAG: type I 3-dehydroquinate dehydratase [Ignavibacteria bacterium]|jgi:shikimate dehydrogenase/3-dehydroquinate dehydratase type I|nr:type I 3-dehydroquinate dehydratase [Ignavibacteria bacterium]MDH7527888.1 type I 3-dehydroquinate dehydratase [Ignavibacteria bacterium]
MIVLSYQPKTYREFRKALKYGLEHKADLIEVRGEKLNEKELNKILSDKSLPKIFTYRINQFSYSKIKDASKKYRIALKQNVEFIDVDINLGKSFINKLKKEIINTKFILSYHNYEKTPKLKYLIQIFDYMRKISADYYKIVTFANTVIDNYFILKLLEIADRKNTRLISHCMGEYGKAGRFLAYKNGSSFFYVSFNSNKQTAEGQIPLENLNKIFKIRQLYPSTRIYGIIGNPLRQSKSWLFHNFGFNLTGSNAIYLNFPITDLDEFIHYFKTYIRGLSITIPYKEEILNIPNISSKIIKEIGSANTAIFKDSKPILFNTDYLGFKEIVKKEKLLQNSKILVIGAGGSARTVIYTLKKFKNEIFLVNRTFNRAENLANEMGVTAINQRKKFDIDFDVLINTTPGNNLFLLNLFNKVISFKKPKLVVDLDLNFKESKLLAMCKTNKIRTINGFEFFINQAIHQFKIFTGKSISLRKVKKFVLENYEKQF